MLFVRVIIINAFPVRDLVNYSIDVRVPSLNVMHTRRKFRCVEYLFMWKARVIGKYRITASIDFSRKLNADF